MSQRSIFNLLSLISSSVISVKGHIMSSSSLCPFIHPGLAVDRIPLAWDACTAGLYIPLIAPIPHCLFEVARDRSPTVQLVTVPRSGPRFPPACFADCGSPCPSVPEMPVALLGSVLVGAGCSLAQDPRLRNTKSLLTNLSSELPAARLRFVYFPPSLSKILGFHMPYMNLEVIICSATPAAPLRTILRSQ